MIRRITAITAVTWTELVRLKVFYFLIIFALLVIGNSFFLARFSFEEEFQMLKDIALGAMSVFSSLLAILATATLLPKDIEDRTIYTVLAKPVSRTEYLLGKLSGVFLLLALAVLLMGAVFAAVLLLRTQTSCTRPKSKWPPCRRPSCRPRWIKSGPPGTTPTFWPAGSSFWSKPGFLPP